MAHPCDWGEGSAGFFRNQVLLEAARHLCRFLWNKTPNKHTQLLCPLGSQSLCRKPLSVKSGGSISCFGDGPLLLPHTPCLGVSESAAGITWGGVSSSCCCGSSIWGWTAPMAAWLRVVTRLACPRRVTVIVVGAFKAGREKGKVTGTSGATALKCSLRPTLDSHITGRLQPRCNGEGQASRFFISAILEHHIGIGPKCYRMQAVCSRWDWEFQTTHRLVCRLLFAVA